MVYCDIDVSPGYSSKVPMNHWLINMIYITLVHGIAIWGICFLKIWGVDDLTLQSNDDHVINDARSDHPNFIRQFVSRTGFFDWRLPMAAK